MGIGLSLGGRQGRVVEPGRDLGVEVGALGCDPPSPVVERHRF